VPRRGAVHDMGRSVTHKAIICYKRLVEQKPTSQVAQETFHSADEVEYYVQCFRRMQLCRDSGMSPDEIAQATGHSLSLVKEYLDLMAEFKLPPLPNAGGPDSVQRDPN
jgi:DNA-binding CsgD family transcriptional regulator